MSAGPSWRTITELEQARWRRFAQRHVAASDLCAGIVADRRAITPAQAAQLAELAAVNGWRLEVAGRGRRR